MVNRDFDRKLTNLEMECPDCHRQNPVDSNFCNACGCSLTNYQDFNAVNFINGGERKHVTVLFSDLTGYTTMSEKLDPEEIKEITNRIFSEISKVVGKYDGFIEKYVGDAVMALFGVPNAHEDDPIRAIKVAQEIHEKVNAISPEVESRIGQPIAMHIGINTGLVVTGEVNVARGTHRVAGDTINLASRFSNLAHSGEIIVGTETYNQAQNYFDFEMLKPAIVKGKQKPVEIYKVISAKVESIKIHRLKGLRAVLTGRNQEMKVLTDTVEQLKQGVGSIICIIGDAGTGKSRLKKEFRDTNDPEVIQWFEGHAYSYTQNIPYFPLISLLTRAFQIKENDTPDKIKLKLESGAADLIGKDSTVIPYLGSLFSLHYSELEGVSPDFWKDMLQQSIRVILSSLVDKGPSVICFEDLHWADPSFVELLKLLLRYSSQNLLFICTFRSHFTLFGDCLPGEIREKYREINLRDLSPVDAQSMLKSILKTKSMPEDLENFVKQKTEGNPFYLEEMVNSLIESQILIRDNGNWKLIRKITESDIPTSIQGLLSARVDRLDKNFKRILQEASVIGRIFLFKILENITAFEGELGQYIAGLEGLDLIRARSTEPELEYIFKHALTQEVVYSGLLKKERQKIHGRIGLTIENLFKIRISEFYETLAFHFKQSKLSLKAIHYLNMAAEKNLQKYSLEESNHYYKESFEILTDTKINVKKRDELLIKLIINWGSVFHLRGSYVELYDLLNEFQLNAESLENIEYKGMFYAWFGWANQRTGNFDKGYKYLNRALSLGEKHDILKVVGYSSAWLIWTCIEMGKLDKAEYFSHKAKKICAALKNDHELYRICWSGIGYLHFCRGDQNKANRIGKDFITYSKQNSDIRCLTLGHLLVGLSNFIKGDLNLAISNYKNAIDVSVDPMFTLNVRLALGLAYVSNGQIVEAENALNEIIQLSKKNKYSYFTQTTSAKGLMGIISLAKGDLNKGKKIVEEILRIYRNKSSYYFISHFEYLLGKVYMQMLLREEPIKFSFILKNIGFLIRNVPFAKNRSERHFKNAIKLSREINAKFVLGQAYLDLGRLYKGTKRLSKAKEAISESISIFKQCEADRNMENANIILETLG